MFAVTAALKSEVMIHVWVKRRDVRALITSQLSSAHPSLGSSHAGDDDDDDEWRPHAEGVTFIPHREAGNQRKWSKYTQKAPLHVLYTRCCPSHIFRSAYVMVSVLYIFGD